MIEILTRPITFELWQWFLVAVVANIMWSLGGAFYRFVYR